MPHLSRSCMSMSPIEAVLIPIPRTVGVNDFNWAPGICLFVTHTVFGYKQTFGKESH